MFYPDIFTLFYVCSAKPSTNIQLWYERVHTVSVFDTLSCMYDCVRCSTAGFIRHLLAMQVITKAKQEAQLML